MPSDQSPASFRLLASCENKQLRPIAVILHVNGQDQPLFRITVGGQKQWVDNNGRILAATTFTRPVSGGRITSPFGWRIHPVLGSWRFHYGVDFALPRGSPVFAAADGVVIGIGRHGNYGKLIHVRHGHGTESTYAHLDGFAKSIKVGTHVKRGQLIAYVGQSGLATGPHLYWETIQGDTYVDPLKLLAEPPMVPSRQMNSLQKAVRLLERTATRFGSGRS